MQPEKTVNFVPKNEIKNKNYISALKISAVESEVNNLCVL